MEAWLNEVVCAWLGLSPDEQWGTLVVPLFALVAVLLVVSTYVDEEVA